MTGKTYPNLDAMFAERAFARKERAAAAFAEKLAVLEKLRAAARELRATIHRD